MDENRIRSELEELTREELIEIFEDPYYADVKLKTGLYPDEPIAEKNRTRFVIKSYEESAFPWEPDEEFWWMGFQIFGIPHTIGPVNREDLEELYNMIGEIIDL